MALVLVGGLSVTGTATADEPGAPVAPWIASDQPDYSPGERVTLNGGSWQPGESVHIYVNDDEGKTWARDVDVTADSSGAVTDSFNLPDWFVATYAVKATGASGAVAAASFTDAVVRIRAEFTGGTTPTSAPVSWVRFGSSDCTGTPIGSGGPLVAISSGNGVNLPVDLSATQSVRLTAGAVADYSFTSWTDGDFTTGTFTPTSNPGCLQGTGNAQNTDVNYAAVTARSTTTTLARTTGSNPNTYGDSVTFTATVTASAGNPSSVGTVMFRDGATSICAAVALSGNTAACSTSSLGTGDHSITAEYSGVTSGSLQFSASMSSALSHTVNKKQLTVTAADASKTYGDADPAFTFSYAGFVLGDTASVIDTVPICTVSGAHVNAGGYPIVCSGGVDNNYAFSYVNGTLTVDPKSVTVTADDKAKTYGSADPTFTFSVTGLESGDSLTAVTCGVAAAHENAGSYPIACSGNTNGNYSPTYAVGTLTVSQKQLTVTAADKSKTFGDDDPEFTFNYAGFAFSDAGADVDTQPACAVSGPHEDVGAYVIACSGGADSNYSFSYVNATLTVDKKELTVTAHDKSKTYGDDDPGFTFDYAGFVLGNTVTVIDTPPTCSVAVAHVNAASYPIGCSGGLDNNYSFSYVNGTLTVNKAPLTVTANDKSREYGDGNPSFTFSISGFKLGDTAAVLDTLPGCTTAATSTSDVGTYPITCSSGTDDNYSFGSSVDGTLTITKAVLTVKADDKSMTLHGLVPLLTRAITGFKLGQTAAVLDTQPSCSTTATSASNVGAYPITCSGGVDSNYSFSYVNGTLTVTFLWNGFLQPINDTAHQTGVNESKFRLGQTIPAKFVLKDANGVIVQQTGNPTFTRSGSLGACDAGATPETVEAVPPDGDPVYKWDGNQYHFNWSTKGLVAGEYRIYANLGDGTKRYVDICLTK